jgi:hypothetical protein
VWAALGLYPQTPGVPMLVLGTPQFPHEVIHGAYGQLTVTASGAGDTYVNGLTVNGTASQHTYISLSGTSQLDFTLSKTPDLSWGSAASDAPPSFGAGPVHFPGGHAVEEVERSARLCLLGTCEVNVVRAQDSSHPRGHPQGRIRRTTGG